MTDKQIDEALELVRAHMQELYEDAAADIQEGGSAESLRLPQSIDAIVQALERQRQPNPQPTRSKQP